MARVHAGIGVADSEAPVAQCSSQEGMWDVGGHLEGGSQDASGARWILRSRCGWGGDGVAQGLGGWLC